MNKFWIVAFLVASCGVYANAQFEDDYDNYFNYDDLEDIGKALDEEINETLNKKTDVENDLKVEEEIQQFREADGDKVDDEAKINLGNIDDYQIEDNRDKSKEENDDKKNLPADSDYDFANLLDDAIADNVENRPEPDDPNAPSRNEDYALLWGDDNIAPLPVPESSNEDENKDMIEETKRILQEKDADDFEEEIKKEIEKTGIKPEEQPNLDQIIEETNKLLAQSDDLFDNLNIDKDNIANSSEKEKSKEEIIVNKVDQEEGSKKNVTNQDIDKDIEDLNKEIENSDPKPQNKFNLDQILEETKQLLEEIDDSFDNYDSNLDDDDDNVKTANSGEKQNADEEVVEKKADQEEEDTVDKVYADLNADLDKLFETLDKLRNDASDNNDDIDDMDKALEEADKFFEELDNKDVEDSNDNNSDDVDLEKILADILSEDDMKVEDSAAEVFEPMLNDALNEPNPDDTIEQDVETLDKKIKPILYVNDALVDEPKENAESLGISDENNANEDAKDASIEAQPVEKVFVDELNSSELQDLVKQFEIFHEEELDVHSDSFAKNVVPLHVTLKLDEPTIINSHDTYPSFYPSERTTDWILEGPGEGIELNITDFAVSGFLGDYLLIKPGGIDESGHDGLVFTYRLLSEHRFRFMDVSRVFMRFQTNRGMNFNRGFSISAKMIAPFLETEQEPVPIPEPVVAAPHSTATVTLALTVADFGNVNETFRDLLADMAEAYIRDNGVDPGLNTTSEITQLTRVDLCPMTWPGFEYCTAVTFGVSLVYEEEDQDPRLNEEDLKVMWTTYVNRDPFALRLSAMGISEFNSPSSAAMRLWLLIASGVIVCMTLLAFVLWRYSCFEGYTRMKAYSDTESIVNEKRNLDLYPTPHQTLPPLYADTLAHEYKWPEDDTRVDIGGFPNNSYTRENMYDFDSDEDVITTRDRKGAVTTKDISNV